MGTSTTPVGSQATDTAEATEVTVQQQSGMILGHVAGYMAARTIDMGMKHGMLARIADNPGITPAQLAGSLGLDHLYMDVWCRGAFGCGVLEHVGDGVRLAPHMQTLLLDTTSPAYAGALFPLINEREMFGRFGENLESGDRMWWNDTSATWIAGVAAAGTPFNTRLIPGGLKQVPGLTEVLEQGCRVVDTACGSGVGVVRLAENYPNCTVTGVDGDQASIDAARRRVKDAGFSDRVNLICSPLEDFTLDEKAMLVVNNISMHECRDIDRVTERVVDALEPGGWFVISDFPFPDTDEGLRTVPGRVMSGIQFFEAQIDDQLLPRTAYDRLLTEHGFTELGSASLTPMHALTFGRRKA